MKLSWTRCVRQNHQPPCACMPACLPFVGLRGIRQRCRSGCIKQHGVDLVRRPTGGRAILHTDELTYSVIAPPTDPRLEGSVVESYMRLCLPYSMPCTFWYFLAEGVEKPVPTAPANNPSSLEHICLFRGAFELRNYCGWKKLWAAPRRARRDGVLQHVHSSPLYGDLRTSPGF